MRTFGFSPIVKLQEIINTFALADKKERVDSPRMKRSSKSTEKPWINHISGYKKLRRVITVE
jgi:hypothetical protein